MNDNYKFIDKNDFLEATRGGFDFYQLVMRKQGKELHQDKPNSLLINPFYNDTKGSLSINYNNGKYLFNDFGEQSYSGDVFDFTGFYYNLNPKSELQQILINACKDLGLYRLLIEKETKKSGIKELIGREKFLEFELDYWASYGISLDILQKFNVVSVDYLLLSKNFKLFSKKQNPIFAYKTENCYKVYQPLSKKYKFNWFPKKKIDTPFGNEQLPENSDLLLITGGEKDVLTLSSLGFSAITLNSETQTNIEKSLLEELRNRFKTIAVLYDIDETGQKSAEQLASQYGFRVIILPKKLSELSLGKDVSDYFKAVSSGANPELFSVERFRELVEKSISIKQKLNAMPDLEYSNLPDFFQDLLSKFDSKQERVLILLSAIVVISGCLPKYFSYYDKRKVYSNLFLFIVGPAASGKGVINFSRILGKEIENALHSKNLIETNEENKLNIIKTPKLLFLPANSSSSGIMELIKSNDESGIIFESEADTLANTFNKKDFGDYSETLRKANHHEQCEFFRRTNKEWIHIKEPKLSVILSGTPNQVFNLIPNSQDGLFSRFIYFLIKKPSEFHNVFEDVTGEIEKDFLEKSKEVKMIYDILQSREIPLQFVFTNTQQSRFNKYFSELEDYFTVTYGEECLSIIRRYGLIFNRIVMIFTLFRNRNHLTERNEISALDIDFDNIMLITSILIQHSIQIFRSYPAITNGIAKLLSNYKSEFYNELPNEFKREDAIKLIHKYDMSISTLDRMLNQEKLFEKYKAGYYKKRK